MDSNTERTRGATNAETDMLIAPVAPARNDEHYSTLEVSNRPPQLVPQPGHLTLQSTYENADDTMEGKEAVPKADTMEGKEAVHGAHASGSDVDLEKNKPIPFWSRRTCGMGMKLIAFVVGLFLMFIIIGAVAGAVTRNKRKGQGQPPPATATTTTPNGTVAAMPTVAGSASTSTSTAGVIKDYTYPFGADTWYTLSINLTNISSTATPPSTSEYFLDATYDADTTSGLVQATTDFSPDSPLASKQWQLRGVPRAWDNASYHPENWKQGTRLYWITSQTYGPDIRLTLRESDWNFRSWDTSDAADFYPMPKNQSDMGQYWFFEKMESSEVAPYIPEYKLYNWRSDVGWPVAYNTSWDKPYLQGNGTKRTEKYVWTVKSREVIDTKDGGFTWMTDSSL